MVGNRVVTLPHLASGELLITDFGCIALARSLLLLVGFAEQSLLAMLLCLLASMVGEVLGNTRMLVTSSGPYRNVLVDEAEEERWCFGTSCSYCSHCSIVLIWTRALLDSTYHKAVRLSRLKYLLTCRLALTAIGEPLGSVLQITIVTIIIASIITLLIKTILMIITTNSNVMIKSNDTENGDRDIIQN